MVSYTYLLLSLFTLFNYGHSQASSGDRCSVKSSGEIGVCELLSNCTTALEDLMNNIYPDICGFEGKIPIVCCITTPYTGYGAKSRQMCSEYVRYGLKGLVSTELEEQLNLNASDPTEFIVGGVAAKPHEFPHMAQIGFDGSNNQILWNCGGSLISDEYVLTAAHCLYHFELGEPKYVRLGEVDSNTNDSDVQNFNIIESIRHPSYAPPSKYNDIALLKLHTKARLNPYVRPACLYVNSTITAKTCVAIGWGKMGFTSKKSNDLLKVTLEFFTNSECNATYKNNIGSQLRNGIVDAIQVCAGSHEEPKDTCEGDSGGPLQIVNPKVSFMYSIVGITSFGKACGIGNVPGVYTRVSSYVDWIEKIVWP